MSKTSNKEVKKVLDDGIILSELYRGTVQVKFYGPTEEKPGRHLYYVNGKRATGVTSFIGIKDKSRPLGIWQQQITADFLLKALEAGKKIDIDLALEAAIQNDVLREEAADIGKEIHAWCEAYIRHKLKQKGFEKLPDMPNYPEAITGVNSFFAWEKEHKVKWISTERLVYSKKHDYVGTMDLEAVIDGKHCLGDFKSSNGLYNAVRMQTAAYAEADMEERGKRFYDGRFVIRLAKYTESEHNRREERKKLIKQAVARIKGHEAKDYDTKPYQVFEAQFLDNDKDSMKKDMKAFLNTVELTRWDRENDPYYNGGIL